MMERINVSKATAENSAPFPAEAVPHVHAEVMEGSNPPCCSSWNEGRKEPGRTNITTQVNPKSPQDSNAMEAQVKAGSAKSIGVSNFNVEQVGRIIKVAEIPPANIQVEMHLYLQQKGLLKYCRENGITVCAYAPLGSPGFPAFVEKRGLSTEKIKPLSPLLDPTVLEMAKGHGKTPSQVLLRFLIQLGVAVIPKSSSPMRIKENFDLFDFSLNDSDMRKLEELDMGKEGRMFNMLHFDGVKNHPEYPW